MTRYAIVRLIDEPPHQWSVVRAAYMNHAYASKKASTIQHSERHALDSFQDFICAKLGQDPMTSHITSAHANEWTASLKKHLAGSSVRTRLAVISAFYEWGIAERYFQENIFRLIEPPEAHFAGRVISEVELSALLPMLKDQPRNLCEVLLYTGIRAGELGSLQRWQVRPDHLYIPSNKSKSSKGRMVPVQEKVLALLGGAPIKASPYEMVCPMKIKTLGDNVRAVARKLGMGRIKLHDFRHTCITKFFEDCDDVGLACQIFGWANANSAIPYQHMTPKRLSKFKVSYPMLEARASSPWPS